MSDKLLAAKRTLKSRHASSITACTSLMSKCVSGGPTQHVRWLHPDDEMKPKQLASCFLSDIQALQHPGTISCMLQRPYRWRKDSCISSRVTSTLRTASRHLMRIVSVPLHGERACRPACAAAWTIRASGHSESNQPARKKRRPMPFEVKVHTRDQAVMHKDLTPVDALSPALSSRPQPPPSPQHTLASLPSSWRQLYTRWSGQPLLRWAHQQT